LLQDHPLNLILFFFIAVKSTKAIVLKFVSTSIRFCQHYVVYLTFEI